MLTAYLLKQMRETIAMKNAKAVEKAQNLFPLMDTRKMLNVQTNRIVPNTP